MCVCGGCRGLGAGGERLTPPGRASVGFSGSVKEAAPASHGRGHGPGSNHTASFPESRAQSWLNRPPPPRGPLAGLGCGSTRTQALGSRGAEEARPDRPTWGPGFGGRAGSAGFPRPCGSAGAGQRSRHGTGGQRKAEGRCLRPPSPRTRPAAHRPVGHTTWESQNAAGLARVRPRPQPQCPVWDVRLQAARSRAPGLWGTAGGRRAAGHPGERRWPHRRAGVRRRTVLLVVWDPSVSWAYRGSLAS